jgi:hypothetical protein
VGIAIWPWWRPSTPFAASLFTAGFAETPADFCVVEFVNFAVNIVIRRAQEIYALGGVWWMQF